MALIRWRDPVDVLPSISGLMSNYFGNDISDYLSDFSGTVPAVNVKETNEDYKLEVAAPGMGKENFNINIDKNVLVISGKKEEKEEEKEEEKDKEGKFSRREFYYSSFQRSFHLPDKVDSDKIEAHYRDGILEVCVPKKEKGKEKESRKIDIK